MIAAALRFYRDVLRELLPGPHGKTGSDGWPLPPSGFIHAVSGASDVDWYLRGGALAHGSMMELLRDHGVGPEALRSVLDFGCGCGRVVRHWRPTESTRVHGVDTNQHLVRWCARRLGFGEFKATGMKPPLPFEEERFDLIYAFSVFTHLTEVLQLAWMDELERVLKPGGYLVISTHGQRSAHDLPDNLKRRFDDGHLVVSIFGPEGGNDCNAFHPPGYFETMIARRFTTVAFRPEGAAGNPPQDLFLLRKGTAT